MCPGHSSSLMSIDTPAEISLDSQGFVGMSEDKAQLEECNGTD